MTPTRREHVRSKIHTLSTQGISYREISRRLGVSRNTVKKWARLEDGTVTDRRRSDRPTKLSPRTKERIASLAKDRIALGIGKLKLLATKKLNFSNNYIERNKKIGATTVRWYVKSTKWGKVAYKENVKPMLSQKNINDRKNFCTRIVEDGFTDNSRGMIKRYHILFTDESPIELNPKPNKQNRRIRTCDPAKIPEIQVPIFKLKVMVAGGISRYSKTELHIVDNDKTVDGDYYRTKILPGYIETVKSGRAFPYPDRSILMQDGAKARTAEATMRLLHGQNVKVWTD